MKCNVDLEVMADKLTAEIQKREKAEAEVVTLNDQADAYSKEVMRLQSRNKDLKSTLDKAERKMIAVLGGGPNDGCDVDSISETKGAADNDESPLLDDALALAEDLSQIVQGTTEDGKETSVLKMLESLQERLDRQVSSRRNSIAGYHQEESIQQKVN